MAASEQAQEILPQVPAPIGEEVQANLGRVSRFADGSTRNWMLFFFFRVLPQQELTADVERLADLVAALISNNDADALKAAMAMQVAIEHPATMNAGATKQAAKEGRAEAEAPAKVFFDWMTLLTGADTDGFVATVKKILADAGISEAVLALGKEQVENDKGFFHRLIDDFVLPHLPDHGRALETLRGVGAIARAAFTALTNPTTFKSLFGGFGEGAGHAGLTALSGGLLKVSLYELLRQMAPAHHEVGAGAMRSEAAEDLVSPRRAKNATDWDRAPVNIAFTYSGLKALQLNETTLASFPPAFKEGMAARAHLLGDTGPSAPENWEGALGLDSVHGYFTGGFLVGTQDMSVPEKHWQRLRDDVRAFNERSGDNGRFLRFVLGAIFKLLGMEILHIEMGEDPHEVGDDGNAKWPDERLEHFGFRDGLSQPFVDLKLGDPPPGGGTPARNRTWAPVAAGEMFLDEPDEDGSIHQTPAHRLLRRGSTFLVFRKLEQDVAGFRMFLAKQRPGSSADQDKLAAQLMGRWPSGTSLITAPDQPLDLGTHADNRINDFLYAADDPQGLSCPLGSHVRRANPRDIGGTDGVRRHRILRRGISYGGPLLPKGVLGDGNKRGLLFIAANSRIDVQFELIQSRWMNSGEFLGQAGLNRCPIIGANSGGQADAFLEAGAVAPVTGLPRFVITRGGDYFFAPGLSALKAMAGGEKFAVDVSELPFEGYSMGEAETPSLFNLDRLTGYADRILAGAPSVIRMEMPAPRDPDDPIAAPVAFVAQLEDVKHVLSMKVNPAGNIINSVAHYHATSQRISRGQDMLVATERGAGTATQRDHLTQILNEGWSALGPDVHTRLAKITKRSIEAALRRTAPSRRIDLGYDLAAVAVYDVVTELFGTPGPDYLTELAVSLPFAQKHIMELPPEWLKAAHLQAPDNPSLATLHIWSILLLADVVANVIKQDELTALSNQGGSEFLTHLDTLIAEARDRKAPATCNLLAAFVTLESRFVTAFGYSALEYYADVRMLLMELAGSAMTNIPTVFGTIMGVVLDHQLPLTELIPILLTPPKFPVAGAAPGSRPEDGVARLVLETARLNAPLPVLMRACMEDQVLPSGGRLNKGDWVAAILAAANIDHRGFPEPYRFSLRPFLPGPERKIDNYTQFGVVGGQRECWGRDRLAMFMLKECLKATGRLQLLQKVAGEAGKPKTVVQVIVGLPARFASVLPDWSTP